MKKKYNRQQVIKVLIDKMLESFGSSYDYVIANPKIDNIPWYQYYTWKTPEDLEKFKEFFIITLTKNTSPKLTKVSAEREWPWFSLMYGLKEDFKNEQKFQEESSR